MKIELRNIKHSEFASQETHCYEATLYVDGVSWGTVYNEGHGGSDGFHGRRDHHGVAKYGYDDIKKLDERIAKEFPGTDYGDIHIEASLEGICCDRVNEFLADRQLKRILSQTAKKNLLYFKEPPAGKGEPLFQVSLKQHPVEVWVKHVMNKHPNAVVINTMPRDEALALLAIAL
jgi:hypothetical protein